MSNTVIGNQGWGTEVKNLATVEFVIQHVHDFAGNCWSQGLMEGSLQYLPHEMIVAGVYNGHNMSGFIIHVNSATPSPYEALFLVGATNLNLGLNLEGIFIDKSANTQTQVPLLYKGVELGTANFIPDYNAKSTLTIQPNSSVTPTTSCFVMWNDATYDITINNSYALPNGIYPVAANDTISNNGTTTATVAFYQLRN